MCLAGVLVNGDRRTFPPSPTRAWRDDNRMIGSGHGAKDRLPTSRSAHGAHARTAWSTGGFLPKVGLLDTRNGAWFRRGAAAAPGAAKPRPALRPLPLSTLSAPSATGDHRRGELPPISRRSSGVFARGCYDSAGQGDRI